MVRDSVPVMPNEIQNRINEISFNSSLLRELRAIEFVQRLITQGAVEDGAMKNMRVHMIADDDLMNDLSVAASDGAGAIGHRGTESRRSARGRRFSGASQGGSGNPAVGGSGQNVWLSHAM